MSILDRHVTRILMKMIVRYIALCLKCKLSTQGGRPQIAKSLSKSEGGSQITILSLQTGIWNAEAVAGILRKSMSAYKYNVAHKKECWRSHLNLIPIKVIILQRLQAETA